jgi:hypothetical protein
VKPPAIAAMMSREGEVGRRGGGEDKDKEGKNEKAQ